MTSGEAILSGEANILVPFHDVDATNAVWHGRYVKYLELARCNMLDKIDYGYRAMKISGYNWPIVDMHLRYYRAITFDQHIRVVARLVEWEYRMRIDYAVYNADTDKRLTTARTDQVAVALGSGEMCLPCPTVFHDRLRAVCGDRVS